MDRRTGALLGSALLVASCLSTASPSPDSSAPAPRPTPTIAASAVPDATPVPISTPTPASAFGPGGWPLVADQFSELVFGNDGTLYLLNGGAPHDPFRPSIVAFDTAGYVKPGWPIEAAPGSTFGTPATAGGTPVATGGSIYVEECGDSSSVGCVVHRFDEGGHELRGWPLKLPGQFWCTRTPSCEDRLVVDPNDRPYLLHWLDAGPLQVIAIDPAGQIKPGWPPADIEGGSWSEPQFAWNSTVYMLWRSWDGLSAPKLAAFGLDGRMRDGWPVSMPDVVGYQVGADGVTAWSWIDDTGELCPNPRRTVFTIIGPDGRTLPGWPRGSVGYASSPLMESDGTMTYVSATGKVYAHDRSGEVKAGWPIEVPGALGNGRCGPAPVYYASFQHVVALGDDVHVLSKTGAEPNGWPYRPPGDLVWPCPDTDCGARPVAPLLPFLVVYVDDPGGGFLEVIAVRGGAIAPGWPYRLSIDPAIATVEAFTLSPDGRLFIQGGGSLVALNAFGNIAP